MPHLTRANRELYRRTPDESFPSLADLGRHCREQRESSLDRWHPPHAVRTHANGSLSLQMGNDGAFAMNDWSFGQLCQLARVNKETVNRLSPETATHVFHETLPTGNKPIQILTHDKSVRSIHGTGYTRLYNVELVSMLQEFATGFQPPQKASTGESGSGAGTGLYCGEQDMFCFLIDPTGWAEIGGQAFAPGFFLWNSEVGKRSLGIETFWFQAVCRNHIVWDAVEVVEFTRKHTASIHDSMAEMRRIIELLVQKRDERRDGFVALIRKAMETKLGQDAEEVMKVLAREGITRTLAKRALEIAEQDGRFTIFSLVDALTRTAGEMPNAGERTDVDQKAARLLALAV